MLTCYKPKTTKDPLMSPHYPYVLVKDEFIGQDRLTVLEWKGKNPHIPYNPRQVPMIPLVVLYEYCEGMECGIYRELSNDQLACVAYYEEPHYTELTEPDWPC